MTSPVLWSSRWHVMSPVRGRTRELGTSGTSRRFQQDGLTLEGSGARTSVHVVQTGRPGDWRTAIGDPVHAAVSLLAKVRALREEAVRL